MVNGKNIYQYYNQAPVTNTTGIQFVINPGQTGVALSDVVIDGVTTQNIALTQALAEVRRLSRCTTMLASSTVRSVHRTSTSSSSIRSRPAASQL